MMIKLPARRPGQNAAPENPKQWKSESAKADVSSPHVFLNSDRTVRSRDKPKRILKFCTFYFWTPQIA